MNATVRILLLGFALLLCPSPASSGESAGEVGSSTVSLTVLQSILLSLENNETLAVERYGPEITETFVVEEDAVFDSVLGIDWSSSETRGQRTSGVGEFTSVKSRNRSTSVGISKDTPMGIGVDLDATVNTRSSNVYTQLYSTRLGAVLTVPLMEGLGRDINLVGVRQAEKDLELSRQELDGFVLALAAQVEERYWNLFLAREELRIQQASLELARRQLEETQDRIEVGEIAEIELAASEGEVALREEDVIDAESAVEKASLRLIRLLNPESNAMWSLEIELLNEPGSEPLDLGPVESHIDAALGNRPDLHQARIQLEKRELTIVRTRNGLLPRLDFFINLGRTGYARSFDNSISGLEEDNFDVTGGFIFQRPFGQRAEQARHRRAQLRKSEAEAALTNLEQLIELDVRTALVEVERTTRQISATRVATRLQEAKYQAEREKFRVGKSTNLLVLTAQRDLIRSQLDEILAEVDRRKALVELYRAEGILLDMHNIVLPGEEG